MVKHFLHGFADHFPRNRVDRRLTDLDWQAGLRHTPNANASINADARLGTEAYAHDDLRTVRRIGIIAAVLDDGGFAPQLRVRAAVQGKFNRLPDGDTDMHVRLWRLLDERHSAALAPAVAQEPVV